MKWDTILDVLEQFDRKVDLNGVTRLDTMTRIRNILRSDENKQFSKQVLYEWMRVSMLSPDIITAVTRKKVITVADMTEDDRVVYKHILSKCDTDTSILRIKHLIDEGPTSHGKRVSGRTIDTLVTRFQKFRNVQYYIDVRDPNHRHICDEVPSDMNGIILFDISHSYDQKMIRCTKAYFDCFGRGCEIEHVLHSGEIIIMSLCKFNFFIWADEFCVFDYMEKEMDTIVQVKRQTQMHIYQPKSHIKQRKRKIHESVLVDTNAHVMLCPRLIPKPTSTAIRLVGTCMPILPYINKKSRPKQSRKKTSKRSRDTPETRAQWLKRAKANVKKSLIQSN